MGKLEHLPFEFETAETMLHLLGPGVRERVTQAGSAELQNAREQRPQLYVLHSHLRPPTLGDPQSDEAMPMELISFFARQRHPAAPRAYTVITRCVRYFI